MRRMPSSISHGLGGHGGIYDKFCEHHVAKGAELWCYDAPGHGRSTTNRPRGTWTMDEWAQASRDWATHVHELTGLPVFTLGSSLGVAPAISAIDSPAVTGAILMGSAAVPGSPILAAACRAVEESLRSLRCSPRSVEGHGSTSRPSSTSTSTTASRGRPSRRSSTRTTPGPTTSPRGPRSSSTSHRSRLPTTPSQCSTPSATRTRTSPRKSLRWWPTASAETVRVEIFADGPHQLMLFETEAFSTLVHEFCTGVVGNE